MRIFIFILVVILIASLLPPQSGQGEEMYIRVIARDDSAHFQRQKEMAALMIQNRLSTAPVWEPAQLQDFLHENLIPADVCIKAWSPALAMKPLNTLYVTIGQGRGHNWWGILCRDAQTWNFLSAQKNSIPCKDAANESVSIVFPWWQKIKSFLGMTEN